MNTKVPGVMAGVDGTTVSPDVGIPEDKVVVGVTGGVDLEAGEGAQNTKDVAGVGCPHIRMIRRKMVSFLLRRQIHFVILELFQVKTLHFVLIFQFQSLGVLRAD